ADVVDVLYALSQRLEHDGERSVLGCNLEQLGGTLALLPEWSAAAWVAARQQQGTGGALAKPRREQGRPADLAGAQFVDLVGYERDQGSDGNRLVGVRDAQHGAVVGMRGLGVDAVPLAQPGADGQRPRRMNPGAVRRVDDQPPIAELIAEPLDDDGAIVGDMRGGLALFGQVGEQVVDGPVVEAGGPGSLACCRFVEPAELT